MRPLHDAYQALRQAPPRLLARALAASGLRAVVLFAACSYIIDGLGWSRGILVVSFVLGLIYHLNHEVRCWAPFGLAILVMGIIYWKLLILAVVFLSIGYLLLPAGALAPLLLWAIVGKAIGSNGWFPAFGFDQYVSFGEWLLQRTVLGEVVHFSNPSAPGWYVAPLLFVVMELLTFNSESLKSCSEPGA
jgi:hypothetical protein